MTLKLDKLKEFTGRPGPLLLAIADGVGIAPDGPANAVYLADTPTIDRLLAEPLQVQLKAHGTGVGLPTDDDMGNSEVGHNAMGAGRVFAQGAKLVNQALENGALFDSALWQRIVETGTTGATVHFLGLLSDGNVHSHIEHLFALVTECGRRKVRRVRLHILLDGRDVAARSALAYIERTEALLGELNREHGVDYRIASGGGRMRITMDRYNADWEMVKRGYDCHVQGVGRVFHSAESAVQTQYSENDDINDQTLEPFVITENSEPVGRVADGDAVVLFNFRGDRAIEISRAFEEKDFDKFDRGPCPDVLFAGMLEYDGDLKVPGNYLVAPPVIEHTVGEYLCAAGVSSFAISETQKYGHVTYFWNGNRSGYIDETLETYVEIPSDNVPFNEAPAMKAVEITDRTVELMRSGDYRFGRLNFANGDMVGHTGDLDATVSAMETVDRCLERLVEVVDELGGILVFTADHGNAEDMFTDSNGARVIKTSHTLNPVPFVIHDRGFREEYRMADVDDPGLTNTAATLLNLMGYDAPENYRPSLIKVG
ncbi:MAG: 2,3-bisphosphoglycerate-independent phosphoglycerate mutase [Gammaproteobacteria bacterium]|nr:2,3-bisphosphoglycerate-independent phosphoglycerate mutase [Gammaproteobacteria bacterium]